MAHVGLENVGVEAHFELVGLERSHLSARSRNHLLVVLLRHQLVHQLLTVARRLQLLLLARFSRLKTTSTDD